MGEEEFHPAQEELAHESSESSESSSISKEQEPSIQEDAESVYEVIREMPRNAVAGSKADIWHAPYQIRPLVEATFQGQPNAAERAKQLMKNKGFVEHASKLFYEPFREDARNFVTALLETGDFPPTKEGAERFKRAAESAADKALIPATLLGDEAERLFYKQQNKRVDELLEQASDPETGRRMKEVLHGPDAVMTIMDAVQALDADVRAMEPEVERAWKERMRNKLRFAIANLPSQMEGGLTDLYQAQETTKQDALILRTATSDAETAAAKSRTMRETVESRAAQYTQTVELLKEIHQRRAELKKNIDALDTAMFKREMAIDPDFDEDVIKNARTTEEREAAYAREATITRQAAEVNAEDLARKQTLKEADDALYTETLRLKESMRGTDVASAERAALNELERASAAAEEVRKRAKAEAEISARYAQILGDTYDAGVRVFTMHPLEFKAQLTDAIKKLGGTESEASKSVDILLKSMEAVRKEYEKEKKPIPLFLEWTKRASGTEWIKRKLGMSKESPPSQS